MRFKVIDNNGKEHITKEYHWDKKDGIPYEEKILEDMEECSCSLNESNSYCDGSCCLFDEGEVVVAYEGSVIMEPNKSLLLMKVQL